MPKNSYRNYVGPSQEYSPGDIDPVSNHVVLDTTDSGTITVREINAQGELSSSAVAQFNRYAESGDLKGYYGYLGSFGYKGGWFTDFTPASSYGAIGLGYHS